MKKIYFFNLLILVLSLLLPACSKNKDTANENQKDTLNGKTIRGTEQNDSLKNFSGYYQGTAKDVRMELNIENFDGKNFSGYNIIFWKPGKGLRADFKGKYDKETRKVLMTESEDIKGAGYFDGYYYPAENKIEGDWFRYSDNGSYKWILQKSNQQNIDNNSGSATGNNFRHFICFGTEPFWNIEVTRQNITFEKPGEKKVTFAYVDPQPAAGFTLEHMRIYNIDVSKNIILTIKSSKGGCSDNMSDDLYPYEATFQYGNTTYSGCAK